MKHTDNANGASCNASSYNVTEFSIAELYTIMDSIPMCINILNEKAENLYCNNYTVNLYGVDSKKTYIEKFYELTPENQPDGRNSKLTFCEHVLKAAENGEEHFSWLDLNASGGEIPLYISIYRLDIKDSNGDALFVSSMRDLRPQLAGDGEEVEFDEYYYSRVTYKDLFNTVAELTEEWFWIYDVSMATIQFFGKGREILGLSAEKQPFPDYVVGSGMVYPDDLDTFLQFNENLKSGEVSPVEVRFILPNGMAKYYRIIYKTIYGKDGNPMFSIGKTYDIDKQKRLEVLSRTDLLTNCLNKITTENVVKDIISGSPTSTHALFLIDVDDFKSVNDELGHYFGDIVLSDIAKNLHSNFRGADIIGRIGGDEFLVFVKDISDERIIKSKAKAIASAFGDSYAGENKDYKISGSIGVSIYPKHADSYEGLYKCSDKALYRSKMLGKDRYTIYSNELADTDTKNLTAVDNANKLTTTHFDAGIASVVFDLMYQAEDVSKAMNAVVRLVGKHMGADRCYVAQTFNGGASYSVSYEWVSDHSMAKKDIFQDVPLEVVKDFFEELEQNGVMYNNALSDLDNKDYSKIPGSDSMASYLLVQTKGKDHNRLVFGIDDSSEHRVWSEKEIDTVQYILKMISIFIASSDIGKA